MESSTETALAKQKQALLELLLDEELQKSSAVEGIPRRPTGAPAPLSYAQQRLWFISQFDGGSGLHNLPCNIRIAGRLNAAALEGALRQVIERHEILRTSIVLQNGLPVQNISSTGMFGVPVIDLTGLSHDRRASLLQQIAAIEAQRPFDLTRAPLLRASLVRLNDEEQVGMFTLHHLVADGWSLGIFLRELKAFYQAACAERAHSLLPMAIQYADYAAWERTAVDGRMSAADEAYWFHRLAGAPGLCTLPSDRPRPAVQTHAGATFAGRLDDALASQLRGLSRSSQVTPFVVLLAGFKALLARYTRETDLLVGVPMTNRHRPELEGLIGPLLNNLVLRTRLIGDPTVLAWIAEVNETVLEAQEHQATPFERVVELLKPERQLSHAPLFQVMFSLQDTSGEAASVRGLEFERMTADKRAAQYDLSLSWFDNGKTLSFAAEYNTDLYDESTVSEFFHRYRLVLAALVREPGARLSSLPLMAEDERVAVLRSGSSEKTPFASSACIHELIEEQVLRTPDAIAVEDLAQCVTYAQLNRRANRLARRLRQAGVQAEKRVGIYVERSSDLVVSLLAVLKAGGAYVPLDIRVPRRRSEAILKDSEARVLLTGTGVLGAPGGEEIKQIRVDADEERESRQVVSANLRATCDPENLAYLIYTSGSTGAPKGVMVRHRAVANFFHAMNQVLGNGSPGRWLSLTSVAFDISVLELLWTLTRGFTVVLQAESESLAPSPPATARFRRSAPIDFSLFYFASDDGTKAHDRYRLLLEGAKFADEHGFAAVWTPERHFHAFGGLYPNPAVTSAAVAAITQRVHIRAGSVVAPLHNPIRIAEEWAVVDNISNGRVGISFASGWQFEDFVLAPDKYATRRTVMLDHLDLVRKLWRGEHVVLPDGKGNLAQVAVMPAPIQKELPVWITSSGNSDTFRTAGEKGANVLTHLLGQDIGQLAEKIRIYREAWREAHQGRGRGCVTLMVHTFVGEDLGRVKEIVRRPFINYLKSSIDLLSNVAYDFFGGSRRGNGESRQSAQDFSEEDLESVAAFAFERFFHTSGLFGTPESCLEMVERLKSAGVDEIAALIDFGIEETTALKGLSHLNTLRQRSNAESLQDHRRDSFTDVVRDRQITHFQCTPSFLQLLQNDAEGFAALGRIRCLLVGGEPFPETLASALGKLGIPRIFNMYGPTETTVWSTCKELAAPDAPMTIGRPLANTDAYIMDDGSRLVPPGISGELCLGGDGIVRGYANNPALTADRFVPHPHGRVSERLYRTGDLGRRIRNDEEIVHLGRCDHQVKIRGYRIELEEIEAALMRHPAMADAAVILRNEGDGDRRLAAYVVLRPDVQANIKEIRAFLQEQLPDYMLPAWIVPIDRLPSSPNGKLDRTALARRERPVDTLSDSFTAPRSELEICLADIFMEVLKVDRVSVTDSFFDRGGHSLLAAQVIARIRERFSVELTLRSFFQNPTIAAMSEAIARERAIRGEKRPPLTRVSRENELPLSFVQERIWFLDRFDPGSPAYNIPGGVRVEGNLRLDVLEQTINELLRRYEILRTNFIERNGMPAQVIHASSRLDLPVIDLQHLRSSARAEAVHRLTAQEAGRPFDLATDRLIRFTVLRLTGSDHVVLYTMHHMVSDGWGWSIGILIQEVVQLYRAFDEGRKSALPELRVQYADVAFWQRQWLRGEALEGQIAYWKQRLAGAPVFVEMPTDFPRPRIQTYRGAVEGKRFDRSLLGKLSAFNQREGVTLFMTLLAAFRALLVRYTGERDVLIGTPVAGRNHSETEALIGCFINTLALRNRMDGQLSVREWLRREREGVLEDFAHQDVPFEQLVEQLQPERDMSHSPFFQVMFVLQNAPRGSLELPGLRFRLIGAENRTAKFDLTLSAGESDDGLVTALEYNTDLFSKETAARLLDHFGRLLEGMIEAPDSPVNRLPLLGTQEISDWRRLHSASALRADPGECLHQIFERQARARPDAIALIDGNAKVSYRALEQRAERLAESLRACGAGPEIRVGICAERSVELIVGILGILKAGSAYVPLDPSSPSDRLALIMDNAEIRILLTQRQWIESLPRSNARILFLEDLAVQHGLPPQGSNREACAASCPEQLAYIIYTSGSTGAPKGILVSHQNVHRLFQAAEQSFQFGSDDVWTLFHSYAFDFSVWEIWGALLHGGALVIVPYWKSRASREFLNIVQRERVTVLNQTPSAFYEFMREVADANWEKPGALREVIFGGEKLEVGRLASWFDRFGESRPRLANMYGITETTVHVTCRPLSKDDLKHPQKSVIGRGLSDLDTLVLHEDGERSPIRVPGELCVGGAGLARGYSNRPDLTADRFVPNPYGHSSGERIYRSGDIVRQSFDGDLEYIGRRDQQIKIRGFRIELGEIRACLTEHQDVSEAFVMAEADAAGGWRLVAYVSPKDGRVPQPRALRSYLEAKLPDYMIPATVLMLNHLPLTVNGKVDVKALPRPEADAEETAEWDAFRSPEEEILGEIWRQVLKTEKVGRHQNFFDRGGHSLIATQMVARVRDLLRVDLDLRTVFEMPTIGALACRIIELRAGPGNEQQTELLPTGSVQPVPLSYGQERLWFLAQLDPNSSQYNIPGVLRMEGTLDVTALFWSLNALVERHEVLRTRFRTVEGQPVQVLRTSGDFPACEIDLGGLNDSARALETQRLIREEARRGFDLEKDWLIRFRCVRWSENESIILYTLHHIVSDAWSMGIMVKELSRWYAGCIEGKAVRLEPLRIQYGDYAIWQRQRMNDERLKRQLTYWQAQLQGAGEGLLLPTDRPRLHPRRFRGGVKGMKLDAALTRQIRELGQQAGTTLFMTVLAAFKALLLRYSGQGDIVIGTPVANRQHPELEDLIGFFVNTLVLRTHLGGDLTVHELLERVKDVALGAYANQEVPFERIVEALPIKRSLAQNPLFQIMFVWQEADREELAGPNLTFKPLGHHHPGINFELVLMVKDHADGLGCNFIYDCDLFEPATIDRMATHFTNLLRGFVADPNRTLSRLEMLSPEECAQLRRWNDTAPSTPSRDGYVHQWIEEQCALTPESVALVFGSEHLTYRGLSRRSSQLARALIEAGVRPETEVGVFLERSLDLPVVLLGIWKAGGAYLPLDPKDPMERRGSMIADAKLRFVVTEARLASQLPGEVCVLTMEGAGTGWKRQPRGRVRVRLEAANKAYVIYTSGSTGRPKGVINHHHGIANRLNWMQSEFRLTQSDRVLQKTPFNFDVSVWEFFWPLFSGAALVIAEPERHRDTEYLCRLVQQERITTIHFVPSMLQAFAAGADPNSCDSLRRIICSGEALPVELQRRLRHWGEGRLYNLYGPTEAAVDVTCWRCASDDRETIVPIGKPIDNIQVYLCDEHFQLVPVGVPGQIYLAGAGVGRGYLNRVGLTAERFMASPFGGQPGSRMYQTGDLGRYREDGAIEFLGRIDHQIKIRGFRIELGEIEHQLTLVEGIREAVVVADQNASDGVSRLVAFVVAAERGNAPGAKEIKEALGQRLPDYMVPFSYVVLPELPLTPTGKVDRKALPQSVESGALVRAEYVAPSNPVENELIEIWQELLNVKPIGVYDSFFDLGGHSLLLTRLASRIKTTFGVQVPLRRLFDAPTVTDMTTAIAAEQMQGVDEEELAKALAELEGAGGDEMLRLLGGQDEADCPPATP